MNVSRSFLLIGVLYLIVGMVVGMYMGGSGDHSFAPVHAHINLLGFTLMTLFAGVYKLFPAMAENILARIHFWLYQVGVLAMLVALFLMLGRFLPEATVGPIMPVTEIMVFLGTLAVALNMFKNAN